MKWHYQNAIWRNDFLFNLFFVQHNLSINYFIQCYRFVALCFMIIVNSDCLVSISSSFVMEHFRHILHVLNNAESIAWCQYYCGVRWVEKDKNNALYPVKETRKSVSGIVLEYKDLNYVIENRTLYWIAKAGSELAGESFYYVFFPACSWIFDIRMARQTLIMFSMAMYVGQALKVRTFMSKCKWFSIVLMRHQCTYVLYTIKMHLTELSYDLFLKNGKDRFFWCVKFG